MDLNSSTELTEPTAESVQLVKALTEAHADAAEVCTHRGAAALPPHPHRPAFRTSGVLPACGYGFQEVAIRFGVRARSGR